MRLVRCEIHNHSSEPSSDINDDAFNKHQIPFSGISQSGYEIIKSTLIEPSNRSIITVQKQGIPSAKYNLIQPNPKEYEGLKRLIDLRSKNDYFKENTSEYVHLDTLIGTRWENPSIQDLISSMDIGGYHCSLQNIKTIIHEVTS